MQRIRETSRGLQVTQEMDIVTFVPNENGDVRVHLKESSLRDRDDGRHFIFEGRDNIRDFGDWLTRLSAKDSSEPTPSSFDTYTVDQHKWVSAVSAVPAERGVGLTEFLAGDLEGLGTDTIEDINAVIDSLGESIGQPSRNLTRVENEAFAYPFGIPEGMTPVLLATQTHDSLQLQFDELFIHGSIPFESAQQLGAWSLQGLVDIQKKSIWG